MRRNEVFLSKDLLQAVESCEFAFGYGDHEQASPTQFTVFFDAGLEGDMTVAEINLFEHAFCRKGFILVEVAEGTVGACGLECLVVQNFCNNKVFCASITIDQADFLTDCKLRKIPARKVIVHKQTNIAESGNNAKLSLLS